MEIDNGTFEHTLTFYKIEEIKQVSGNKVPFVETVKFKNVNY